MDAGWFLEIQWITAIQDALGGLSSIIQALTFLGSEDFFILAMPILYWCVDASLGFRVGLILLLSGQLNGILKVGFHSPRPFWVDPAVKPLSIETSFGLPSGHSMNTFSIWGLAAILFKRRWFAILSLVVIFLVGFSRLALGMHFISDVLTGWLFGLVLLAMFIMVEKKISTWLLRQNLAQHIMLAAATTLLLILLGYLPILAGRGTLLPDEWIQNALMAGKDLMPLPYKTSGIFTAAGTWLGMGIGVAIIHSRGGLPRAGSPKNQLLRYFIGMAGLMTLWYGLGALFPRGEELLPLALRLLRYSLIGVWIGAGAPLVFMKFRLSAE